MTLTDFLLTRIAEDAADEWHSTLCSSLEDGSYAGCDCGVPGRARTKCEADRRIVNMMDNVLQSFSAQNGGPGRPMWDDVNRRERHHANETLHVLALPYVDHPDYRQEWKP